MIGDNFSGFNSFLQKEIKRATIVFVAIVTTFCLGLYAGSIGVVDPVGSRYWFWSWYSAQVMVSPMVAVLGHITAGGSYPVYGKPCEIGQVYTGIAGLLNLLCIVNAVYLAHKSGEVPTGG